MIRKCQVHIRRDLSFFHYVFVLIWYKIYNILNEWTQYVDAGTLFQISCVQDLCGTKLKLYIFSYFYIALSPEFGDYFTKKLECVTSLFQNFKLNRIFRTSKAEKKKQKKRCKARRDENGNATTRKNTSHYFIDRFIWR